MKINILSLYILLIAALFSCSSSTVVADENKPSQDISANKISAAMAPAAPNESVVMGTVSAYCEISSRLLNIRPEMVIYKITVLVESSKNIEDYSDFTRGKEGRDIELLTKQKPPAGLFGKKIKVRVTLRGDARGSNYWIKNLEVLR